ncbi:MAG: uracil-DNA glycosylase family protein [Verrucomicrobiales bacterium]
MPLSAEQKKAGRLLHLHVEQLLNCRACPLMHKPVVSGGPVVSKVMLVGQAPGDKEPVLGRPFAWTAGKTLFRWFEENASLKEDQFRNSIYMAAVCRCFPGKKETGGDRVPNKIEISNCSNWMAKEIAILKPELVVAVGKLGIEQFLPEVRLDKVVGKLFRIRYAGHNFDLAPLPHPSGASPWHRMEPGKTLLKQGLALIRKHPAYRELLKQNATSPS